MDFLLAIQDAESSVQAIFEVCWIAISLVSLGVNQLKWEVFSLVLLVVEFRIDELGTDFYLQSIDVVCCLPALSEINQDKRPN